LSFCREFFRWYDDEHYHTGIGLLTPSTLHYGKADKVAAERHLTLQSAYTKHPERFVHGCPKRQQAPAAVWINPPTRPSDDAKKRPPETNWAQRPDAPLTHPRPGYPSSSCVPAELDSVSTGNAKTIPVTQDGQPPLNTRAMPEKIPGVWGLAPADAVMKKIAEKTIH
jgi:putative transposase